MSIDTRHPRMFSDLPVEEVLKKAVKISDLKNLGESSEREFAKVGITKASHLVKLGWKKAMIKLIKLNPRNNHLMFARAIIGAIQNKNLFAIDEADILEAKEFLGEIRAKSKTVKCKPKK